jgi:predicted dehydrogenase
MTNRLRTALVGCGGMGHRHLSAYAALRGVGLGRFEIAAVCDISRDAAGRASELAERFLGVRPAVCVDVDELIGAADVQALDVVTSRGGRRLGRRRSTRSRRGPRYRTRLL